ncbi:hypothetical protein IJ847_02365 [Candidatus Saccharibacteria bacterium]|nr:hypothetical protein [Candidatus Saccharibacteria bacterium]
MKRITLFFLATLVAICLCACGSHKSTNDALDDGLLKFTLTKSGSVIREVEIDEDGSAILAEDNGKILKLATDGTVLYGGSATTGIQDWPEKPGEITILENPAGYAFCFSGNGDARFVSRLKDELTENERVVLYDHNMNFMRSFPNAIAYGRGEVFEVGEGEYAEINIVYRDEKRMPHHYSYQLESDGHSATRDSLLENGQRARSYFVNGHLTTQNYYAYSGPRDEVRITDKHLLIRDGRTINIYDSTANADCTTITLRYDDMTIDDLINDLRATKWDFEKLNFSFYS